MPKMHLWIPHIIPYLAVPSHLTIQVILTLLKRGYTRYLTARPRTYVTCHPKLRIGDTPDHTRRSMARCHHHLLLFSQMATNMYRLQAEDTTQLLPWRYRKLRCSRNHNLTSRAINLCLAFPQLECPALVPNGFRRLVGFSFLSYYITLHHITNFSTVT